MASKGQFYPLKGHVRDSQYRVHFSLDVPVPVKQLMATVLENFLFFLLKFDQVPGLLPKAKI